MLTFEQCPIGTRVTWEPTNKPGEVYTGVVVAHNRTGDNIFDVPGYAQHKPKTAHPRAISPDDRALVDRKGEWHAQPLYTLRLEKQG
jgi:hypothetical protein